MTTHQPQVGDVITTAEELDARLARAAGPTVHPMCEWLDWEAA